MSFFLKTPPDFDAHNARVRELWDDYARREQARVPVMVQGSIRNLISNPAVNDTRQVQNGREKIPHSVNVLRVSGRIDR